MVVCHNFYGKGDEARNCSEMGMFGMVILSEFDHVEDLGFAVDLIVCLLL